MILLKSAIKLHFSEDKPPKLVFKRTTLALPTDRRVAILGERLQGKSSLLRLLAGVDAPTMGTPSFRRCISRLSSIPAGS